MSSETPGLDLDVFRAWYDGQRPGELGPDLRASLIAASRVKSSVGWSRSSS